MPKGGARNRSGPSIDPNSARSELRGVVLTALPAEGYQGDVPDFPLSRSVNEELTAVREVAVWHEAWTSPQACAWAIQSWRWPVIAEYCRLKALVELSPASTAALIAQIHRYRDQIGLTPAGLKENGWAIAEDKLAERRAEKDEDADEPDLRDRFTVVPDGTDG